MNRETGRTVVASPLDVAAEAYYWKPANAWFRALELKEYERLDLRLPAPTLDLGCGDGRVAWMLEQLGQLAPQPFGMDISRRQLRLAARLTVHGGLVQGDATRLPFADGAFGSVVCNGVLCSIPGDFRLALAEIHRVVQPGGEVVISVPTDRFEDVLFWPRLLGRVSGRLRARYERAMDARQPHFWTLTPAGWREELEKAGFEVYQTRPFFGRSAGVRWNLLAMHVLRFFGALRLLDVPPARRAFTGFAAGLHRRPYEREARVELSEADEAGYVLFGARRR